jgi:hypothetical protein
MSPDAARSQPSAPPSQFGKVKPASAQDIVWGRPVFRAPDLPPTTLAFQPWPERGQFFGGQRAATP